MVFVKKHNIFQFLILSLSLSSILSEIVEIDDGKIEGTTSQSRLNKDFFAFFKIPYGQPPLGHLRFQEPKPVEKWNGILNGMNPGPSCYQLYPREGESEDCLQLNVFSKNLTSSKPVIVFIHGGGYEVGSGLDQGLQIFISKMRGT